jgi:hypothetical protein
MENPTSITGQILSLHEQGYSAKEILLEMKQRPGQGKLSQSRVNTVLQRETSRSADSRRIYEVYEMCLEILAATRQLLNAQMKKDLAQRMREIERKKIRTPSSPGKAV